MKKEGGGRARLWEGVALGVTVGEMVGVGLEMAAASSRRGPNRRKRTRSRARMGKGSPRRSSRESRTRRISEKKKRAREKVPVLPRPGLVVLQYY